MYNLMAGFNDDEDETMSLTAKVSTGQSTLSGNLIWR